MQEAAVAAIVAIAFGLLAARLWRAVRRRCRPAESKGGGCGKCSGCG